jgi:hypothetical protein
MVFDAKEAALLNAVEQSKQSPAAMNSGPYSFVGNDEEPKRERPTLEDRNRRTRANRRLDSYSSTNSVRVENCSKQQQL